LGSGFYTAIAVASLGANSKPREAFNWMLLAFAVSQFLELQLIPRLTMDGIYYFFIATYLITLPFVRMIPIKGVETVPRRNHLDKSTPAQVSVGWYRGNRHRPTSTSVPIGQILSWQPAHRGLRVNGQGK
jgi:hypothetical protein